MSVLRFIFGSILLHYPVMARYLQYKRRESDMNIISERKEIDN